MKSLRVLAIIALASACMSPVRAETSLDLASVPVVERPVLNETFGRMFMPRLKSKFWGQKLIAGIAKRQLNAGIGYFPQTALPGQIGNFAVAGHRATYGEPLAFVDKIRTADKVYVQTAAAWYIYTMTNDRIVKPQAMWVIDPVPGKAWDATPTKALITIVTCEPRYGSSKRWIWWGELSAVYAPDTTLATIVAREGA